MEEKGQISKAVWGISLWGISPWAEHQKCRILDLVRKPPLRAAISRVFNLLQGISHVVA